jgi:type VI secretion system secreted protein VgrG
MAEQVTFRRLLTIASPLGDGALTVTRLSATEELGLPYAVEVDVLGADSILPSNLLTQPITVTVWQRAGDQDVKRHFHGLVAQFERLGPGPSQLEAYRLVAVPGIWRLGLKRNCRVFQGKTAQEIVNTILAEHDQPTPTWGILPDLQAIDYCTQFNETDLHFVSRLLEEHGLTYYFTHSESSHTLCISSTAPGFPSFEGGDVKATQSHPEFFDLRDWRRLNRARTAGTDFHDMDGERSQPSVVLSKSSDTRVYADEPSMWSAGKRYRWPGGMSTRPGVDPAKIAMASEENASENYGASALDPRFVPGARMNVGVIFEDGSEASEQYVVTAMRHAAEDASRLGAGSGGLETYSGLLTLVKASRDWMPQPQHERPVMAGLYSATVTGPQGEKIHVDEFGRIKIRFRWDRLGPDDDASSIWVRAMQAAGGAWGGTWFLPRVGDEVLVAFLDGDPDRPIVTGAVYGKDAKPPFEPGTNKAQSGIRTRSYKSDSDEDANILRFEDKKDSEEVLLHAQKNLTVEVEHDETRTVQNARTATIKDSHDTLTVETGNRITTVKTGNDTHTVETGNRSATIKKGNESVTVEMGNESHAIKMGNMTVKCDLGSITLEAMQSITLKVGQSSVVVDQMGVTVKGMTITQEAQLMCKSKGVMVQEEASAMVQVQGGIVMIN